MLIAGCRDSLAARQLGFVPVHGLGAALEMARGSGADADRLPARAAVFPAAAPGLGISGPAAQGYDLGPSRSGGIGRRAGLKIRFPQGSGGSIPPFGIQERHGLSRTIRLSVMQG